MRKPLRIKKCDGRTDRRTDIPTDTARCRVACPRLKSYKDEYTATSAATEKKRERYHELRLGVRVFCLGGSLESILQGEMLVWSILEVFFHDS